MPAKRRVWITKVAFVAVLYAAMQTRAELFSTLHSPEVWVFTTVTLPPLHHIELATQVMVLDGVDRDLASLSFPYPGELQRAREQALAAFQSEQGRAMVERMRHSMQSVAVAWQHGIAKLPAVLIDDTYVVYGVYDIAEALARVQAYRDAH